MNLTRYWKAAAPLAAFLGEIVAANLVHGTALHYVQVAIAALGFIGTLATPANAAPTPPPK